MKHSSFYLAGSGSCAYAFQAPGVCLHATAVEGHEGVGRLSCFDAPQPQWVPCSESEFQAVHTSALAALGLVDENAPFLALCDAFDAQEAAAFPFS